MKRDPRLQSGGLGLARTNPSVRFLQKCNPFRPAGILLIFVLCLWSSLDRSRLPIWKDVDGAAATVKQHARSVDELDSGIVALQDMIRRDFPNAGPLAKPVVITAATGDPVEYLLTAAYQLLTFSTLDPIHNSVTACVDESDDQFAAVGTVAPTADDTGHCNVALLVPVRRKIAQHFRAGEALAFTLRHELAHAIFLDRDAALLLQFQSSLAEKGELLHSVLIETEADVYALQKTAQRSGSKAAEDMLDGLINLRRIQPRDARGASAGSHDTTDALAIVAAHRQWFADAVGIADAAVVRQTEQIAIDGFKAYAARNGLMISPRLDRALAVRQATFATPAVEPYLGKLAASIERAPIYAAAFGGDGDELTYLSRHPLLGLIVWSIVWSVLLRGGWLSVDLAIREISGGRNRELARGSLIAAPA
jgi:hypothetical protein